MKLRTYRVYWIRTNGIRASKATRATNIDELIDILREVIADKRLEAFVVVNPEGINILTEIDLLNRR